MNTSSVTRTGVLAATGNKDEAEEDSVSLGFYLSLEDCRHDITVTSPFADIRQCL